MNDPYQILGISKSASSAEIKRAYRKQAQKYHPDKNSDPSAEATFKLIGEAFEFLSSGKSNSGAFVKQKPVPKPKPKPKPKPSPVWQTGYGATNVEKIQLLVTFTEAFTGAKLRIPNTPFSLFVRPGIQNGHKERRLCQTQDGNHQAYFDIEYKLYDPSGFYKFLEIDGVNRFCCHLTMTTGQLLCEFQHTLKNINPSGHSILFTVPIDYKRFVVVKNVGLRLDESGNRGDLYVITIVNITPIEKEIYPVLSALYKKVKTAGTKYQYFS